MHSRALELIATLGLTPHREGGHFHLIHRSANEVDPLDGRTSRPALTTIYFLLTSGEVSRWHRVQSDEVWHHLEGDPLELRLADPALEHTAKWILGPHGKGTVPVRVVPAGSWQAARTTGAYTLAGCTVGPGFDYDDFVMLCDQRPDVERLKTNHPELADFL